MSDESAHSSAWLEADVGGYNTGSEASTDDRHHRDAQMGTLVAMPMSMSMMSDPGLSGVPFMSKEVNLSNLFSIGGEAHVAGRCKPCAFFHKQGCANGGNCIFCHQCPPHEKQRRKRLRRRMLRERFAPASQGAAFPATKALHSEDQGNGSWGCQDVHREAAALSEPSLLATAPPTGGGGRFVQDEPSYAVSEMPYHSGPIQYTFVPVQMPMQQQHQQDNCMAMAMNSPYSPYDPNSYAYGDASGMQWVNNAGTPYMCVVGSPTNGSGYCHPDVIEVPAF